MNNRERIMWDIDTAADIEIWDYAAMGTHVEFKVIHVFKLTPLGRKILPLPR